MNVTKLRRLSPGRIARTLLVCGVAATAPPASAYAASGAAVAAWGENSKTQLGAGYKSGYEESPMPVLGLTNATQLAAGEGFSLALLANGTVRAWGGNAWGQLGDGTELGTWEKGADEVTVAGLSGVKAIAADNQHSLALLENGTVDAWGNDNDGQLGNGKGGTEHDTGENQMLAKPVGGLSAVIAIASGGGSNFALLANHTVVAWGRNNAGQLGIGEIGPETCVNELSETLPCSKIPRPVGTTVPGHEGEPQLEPLQNVVAVSAGAESAYALLSNHHVMSWGNNKDGQLGTGGELVKGIVSPEPVRSAGTDAALTGVVAVSAGGRHVLALLEDGKVVGWGENDDGELGKVGAKCTAKLTCATVATAIPGLEHVTALATGQRYSLAVIGGRVYAFGENESGQLGDGGTANSAVPTVVPGLGSVSAVAAGNTHVLALLAPGVQPPAPALAVEPGIGSLSLSWTMRSEKFLLSDRIAKAAGTGHRGEPRETDEALKRVTLGEGTQHYTFTGLTAQPYEVVVATAGHNHSSKRRVIFGSPLA